MICKFAPSGPKSPVYYTSTKPDQSMKARIPESISFASHVSDARISIKRPRRATRIEASYAVTARTAESLYEVLGIGESACSPSDIKKAYKQMARKYHPDVSAPERVDENTRRFIMIHEAYETLSNPQTKALYDRNLTGGGGGGGGGGAHHQETEKNEEWKVRWQSQLYELNRRSNGIWRRERMSWGARMRSQTQT